MQLIAHKCNSKSKLHSIKSTTWIEFDVCFSTLGKVVVCHDQEDRNDPSNVLLKDMIDYPSVGERTYMIDIKACGISEAESLARNVLQLIRQSNNVLMHNWYLGSFNEYCVIELASHNPFSSFPYKIGVISAGIPLGVFNHLEVDYAVIQYSVLTLDISQRLCKEIEVFAYTVNSIYGENLMKSFKINGYIKDLSE
jgi:hypothetical protein